MSSPQVAWDEPDQKVKWDDEHPSLSALPQADTSFFGTLGREVKSLGTSIAGAPRGIYHAFKDEPTLDEKMMYEPKMGGAKIDDGSLRHRLGLGIARLTSQPVDIADEAYRNHRVGYEEGLGVAPEAVGIGAAAPVTAKLIGATPKVAGAIAENAPKIGSTVAAIAKPAARMGLEVAKETPIIGGPIKGMIKGAKAFQDVPSQLRDIWRPPAQNAPNPVTNLPEPTGQRPIAQVETSPAPVQVPKIGDFAKQVVKAAGGNPEEPNITPGKPIARRPIAVAPAAPKDMTPVEDAPKGIPQETPELKPVDSSALSGYHYDPQTQTMTIGTKSGGMYRYGEVTPEEASAFDSADSKGKAFKDIRDNHVQTAKRVGEKWVSGKPSAVTASPDSDVVQVKPLTPKIATRGDDLEAALAKSIQSAKAKKK